jgi:ABC-type multidrug transport system fused ATPase/permease subunit
MTTDSSVSARMAADIYAASPKAAAPTARETKPLVRLVGCARRHPRAAVLTLLFGLLGFGLSFVYPWIIGSVVDLLAKGHASPAQLIEHRQRILHLGGLALGTAFLHALVVYGRGHANVHLGDGVVTDLRFALFAHLQKLGLGFYTRERTGAISLTSSPTCTRPQLSSTPVSSSPVWMPSSCSWPWCYSRI